MTTPSSTSNATRILSPMLRTAKRHRWSKIVAVLLDLWQRWEMKHE